LALLIGLLPLLPYVLTGMVFAVMYVIGSVLALFMITYCGVTGRRDPVRLLTALFTLFTNTPIAFMTLRPVSFAALRSAKLSPARESAPSPLPAPPPGAAAKADSPLYWVTVQRMAEKPGGRPDIVPPSHQPTQQTRGRHARQEAPDSAEAPAKIRYAETVG
jgi:hypothetical protein